MDKTLIIGVESYIAKNYINEYQKFFKAVATSYRSLNPIFRFDLFKPDFNILDNIIDENYKYAIIFAGITNVFQCEKEKEYTYRCNVEGIIKTAKFCRSNNIVPIVFSSDYVFDGKKGNYLENAPLNPLNEYGKQKAILENQIQNICGKDCMILRLSKVFDCKSKNKNFLGEIIYNLVNDNKIQLAFDQIFSPIYIKDLIHVIFQLQKMNYRGLINIGDKESINRYDLAKKITKICKKDENLIEKISIDNLNANFKIPKNISINCKKLFSHLKKDFKPIDFYIRKSLNIFDK